MRRTLMWMLATLMLSAALCAVGTVSVTRAVDGAEAWLERAEAAVRSNDPASARDALEGMEREWRHRERLLELMTVHDALSEVEAGIRDAAICLESGDRWECLRATAALTASLERIRITEAVRLMNLF